MPSPAATPSLPYNPATLSPPLEWLVRRSGIDEEAWTALSMAAPDAIAPGAADPTALLQGLLEAALAPHALRTMAAALPPREGVWWAFVAAQQSLKHATDRASPAYAAQSEILSILERWIARPADDTRRAAWLKAQEIGLDNAASCTAAAAFFAAGSIASGETPTPIPPPPGLHTLMAGTAVLLAALAIDPDSVATTSAKFIANGLEIVRKGGSWEVSLTAAKKHFDLQEQQHAQAFAPPEPKAN